MFPMLYHEHHSLTEEDIPFWKKLAAESPGPILELGCGTGRVLLPLLAANHKIIGLDNDYAMLAYLRAIQTKCCSEPPSVFQADCTSFHLGCNFNLVIMPCNTYSTLPAPDRNATLRAIAHHLNPEGMFVFSMPNPVFLQQLPSYSEPEIEDVFPHPLDGEPVQVSSSWQRTRIEFILRWNYDHLLPNGRVQRTAIEITHYLQPLETYTKELVTHGFLKNQLFGDYDWRPYSKSSPNLIIKASRSAGF